MYERYGKRLLDIVLSLAATIILAIPMGLVALWIKLDSPGPVFFKQRRIGKGKTHFNILKFRTMRGDTPHDVPTHLLKDADSYITGSGAFLRKTSLDELPQIYNILAGQMSVIGPRPALYNQYDLIEARDKVHANDIRPGLTGLAQVNGRDELPIDVKARYDGEYAAHVTFWNDVKIFFRSITYVFQRRGVVEGTDTTAEQFAAMLSISLQSIKQYHDEKFDKTNFIKNVVLDNILPGDIYAKARELHFVSDVQRVVLLIRVTSGNDISAYDVVSGLFPDKQKDFVFNISETDTVLVKEIKPDNNTRDMEKLAASIVDTLQGDHYIKAVVGIGTPIGNIKDLASSFKEAQIAMEVGKVFDTERQVISYDHLGIARLIYQLPTTLCEAFLREVFKQESIDSLDAETLFTIQRFFENNLNVSETSRGLFVHRNTLVYRLEKIRKLTGLDLRNFDDAIVFKVALMVKKYLSANPAKY